MKINAIKVLLILISMSCLDSCIFTNELWRDRGENQTENKNGVLDGYFFDKQNEFKIVFLGKKSENDKEDKISAYYSDENFKLAEALRVSQKFDPSINLNLKLGRILNSGKGYVTIYLKKDNLSKEDLQDLRQIGGFTGPNNNLVGMYDLGIVNKHSFKKELGDNIYRVKWNTKINIDYGKGNFFGNTLRVILTPVTAIVDTVVVIVGAPIFIVGCYIDSHCMK